MHKLIQELKFFSDDELKFLNEKIDKMEFQVSGEIDVDILLGRSDEGRAGFQSINIDAYIESPDLNEEEKIQFLHEVDRRCPVSETVLNGSSVGINLAESLAIN